MSGAVMRSIGLSVVLVLLALGVAPLAPGSGPASSQDTGTPAPPVAMTAQQDHQRIMDILHITSLRRGADGNNPQAPNAANYDEAKANPYPNLPDPLVLKNGHTVKTAKAWLDKRRPEIVEDFDREIYGRVPNNTPRVKWEVTGTKSETNGNVPSSLSSSLDM